MKINKNSWHFKLQEKYDTATSWSMHRELPVSLCKYFWSTIGCLLLELKDLIGYLVMGVFIVLMSTILLSPLYFFLVAFTGLDLLGKDYANVGAGVLFLELITVLYIGCCHVKDGTMKIWPKWLPLDKLFSKSKPAKSKQPSLFVEYFKAKKAKICPLIKLEE